MTSSQTRSCPEETARLRRPFAALLTCASLFGVTACQPGATNDALSTNAVTTVVDTPTSAHHTTEDNEGDSVEKSDAGADKSGEKSEEGEDTKSSESSESTTQRVTETTSVMADNVSEIGSDQMKVYHDRLDWLWLDRPGELMPGARIYNLTKNTSCTAGWFVGQEKRRFIITAGHCGSVGDEFGMMTDSGLQSFGNMLESEVNYVTNTEVGTDIGLIEINPESGIHWTAEPPTGKIKDWLELPYIEHDKPTLCSLGATSGLSCGAYLETAQGGQFFINTIADFGDSGGPVYAVEPDGDMLAVAIVSRGSDYDKTRNGVMSIQPLMEKWDLQMYS